MILSFEDLILEAIETETDIEAMVGVCETMGDAVMYAHGDELGIGLLEGVVLDEEVFCAEADELYCVAEETLEIYVEKAEEDPEAAEAKAQKKAVGKFKVRNFANIMKIMMVNARKAKGLVKTRVPLMKMVDNAKNERELKFLYDDATIAINSLATNIQVSPALKPELDAHLEWLRKTYKPAIKSRMQEIQRFNMVEDTDLNEAGLGAGEAENNKDTTVATVTSPSSIDGCCGKEGCGGKGKCKGDGQCGNGGGAAGCKGEAELNKPEKGATVESPSSIENVKEACGPTSIPHEVPSHKPQNHKSNTYETDSDADNEEEGLNDLVIASENGLADNGCEGDQAQKDEIEKGKAKDEKHTLSDKQDGDVKNKDCIKESHYDMDEVVEQLNSFNEEVKDTMKSATISVAEGVFTFTAYNEAEEVVKESVIYDIFDESFDPENVEGTALAIGEKVEQMFNISEMADNLATLTLAFSEEVQVVLEACKAVKEDDDEEEEEKDDKECKDKKDKEDSDDDDDEESEDDDKEDDDKDDKKDDDKEEESEEDDEKDDDKKDSKKKDGEDEEKGEEEPVDEAGCGKKKSVKEAAEEGCPCQLSKEDHTNGQHPTLATPSFSDEATRKNTNKSEAELNKPEKGATLVSDNDIEHIKESVASDSSIDALPGQTPAKLPSGTDAAAKETETKPSDPECKVATNGQGVTVKATSDIEAECPKACKESATGLYESAFASLFKSPKK